MFTVGHEGLSNGLCALHVYVVPARTSANDSFLLSYARCSNHLTQCTTTHVAASTHEALPQYSLCIMLSQRYASAIEKIVIPAEKTPERWTALYPRSVIPGCLLVTCVIIIIEMNT